MSNRYYTLTFTDARGWTKIESITAAVELCAWAIEVSVDDLVTYQNDDTSWDVHNANGDRVATIKMIRQESV